MRLKAFIICILLSFAAAAQQPAPSAARTELENRRKQIMEAIKQTEEQLDATKKNKNATMGQLRALQAKLAERQRLIGNINDEIGEINNSIQQSSKEVLTLRQQLEQYKMRYAQSLRYAYETRSSYDMMAFLFSSNDFNDAVRRIRYLKKFRDYRKEQVEQIRQTQNQIQNKIGVLNNQKNQKDQLLSTQVQQKQVFEKETNETNEVVKDLKGQEKQLMAEIERNRKAAAKVNKAISDVIRREIEAERRKAEEEERKRQEEERRKLLMVGPSNTLPPPSNNNGHPANGNTKGNVTVNNNAANNANNNAGGNVAATRPVPRTNVPAKPAPAYNLSITPEAMALSNSFENNHGRLPWPVEKGFISDQFGRHPHPVYEKVMIENNGIDIRTTPGASARAIFDGKVVNVFSVTGDSWIVIVSHGRYYSVYNGLSKVYVKKDQAVHTKEVIGTVGNNDEGEPTINLQIWKDQGKGSQVKIDPTPWIAR
ncbi:MAG: peptidoglycan DD-metalloendopeptidase family protein [Bacteroidetes bacterium]|nr:peptidoglycan DD-metalloendopeptidase family protein [Bacteroidota bacterium]